MNEQGCGETTGGCGSQEGRLILVKATSHR